MTTTTYTVNLDGVGPVDVTRRRVRRGPALPAPARGRRAGHGRRASASGSPPPGSRGCSTRSIPGFGGTPRPEALHTRGRPRRAVRRAAGPAGPGGRHGGRELDRRLDRRRDGPAGLAPHQPGHPRSTPVGMQVPGHPLADFFSLTHGPGVPAQLPRPRPLPHRPRRAARRPRSRSWPATAPRSPPTRGTTMARPHPRAGASPPWRPRPWCCGATATRSSPPTTAGPRRTPSRRPGSSCSPTPGTCPRSRPPTRCSRRSADAGGRAGQSVI